MIRAGCLWLGAAAVMLFPLGERLPAAEKTVRFNRDIRPIMSDTCFRCHGPDASTRMAGLRLDIRDEALRKSRTGVIPIVPGDPAKSAVVQRVLSTHPARVMPPRSAHKELTETQKKLIERWVAEGAEYEGHWAYEPVRRPPVPAVTGTPEAPVHNPVDAFIRERLALEKLSPAGEADRRTLLRRVTLDLTGIPPKPEEYAAYLSDTSPEAFDKVVDRLLASPRYAEMQAMRWLDAVRYADSSGFHGDNLWPAWPYRDYVLRAFHDNMPFDRFTREQIAGDLLPEATLDQKIASAYNRLNRASAEGGLQPKEYLAKYGADRVRTTSTVWMAATLGCAECHDHKFDPFTAKDFYSMKAFFADIRETGLVPDRGAKAWGSKLALPSPEQKSRMEALEQQIKDLRTGLEEQLIAADEARWKWEARILAEHAARKLAWQYPKPLAAEAAQGATLTIHNDTQVDYNYYLRGSLASEKKRGGGLIVASGENPDNEVYTVRFRPGAGSWYSLGVEIQQDDTLPGNRLSRGADRFVLTEVEAEAAAPGAQPQPLRFELATTTGFGETVEHPAMAAIDGDRATGWAVSFGEHRNAFLALRLAEPFEANAETVITLRLKQESVYRRATFGRFRVAISPSPYSAPETGDSGSKFRLRGDSKDEGLAVLNVATDFGVPPDVLRALEIEEPERSEAQQKAVLEHFAWTSPEFRTPTLTLAKLELERSLLDAAIPRVLLTERMRPRVTRVLARGNFMDESGEIVEPAIPQFLGTLPVNGERATRLDLATWIVSPSNPLTARVFVNRLWRQFFGTGLSKVMDDMGSQGEWPTHLVLLDWLAAEFIEPTVRAEGTHAWDMKHMIRTIVTSHTYRQSSQGAPEVMERDPDNRLLARQSRYRVDAEIVHDIALAVSGLLNERFGGPSVRPYQPEGYLAAMNFPKREYSASRGDDLYRRALYIQWQRTFLHPTLATLDAPTREECTVNRVNSNTPLQALVLLNDPIFVEASRAFAQQILQHGGRKFDAQLEWAFERALNRKPTSQERKILTGLHAKSTARFQKAETEANEFLSIGESSATGGAGTPQQVAAMTVVARAILNLHETITRN
jgi:hypothetical protein